MPRLGAIQSEVGLLKNVEKGGVEYLEFSPELRDQSNLAVVERAIPNWAQRVSLTPTGRNYFNEEMGRVVGYRIEPNGSGTKIPGGNDKSSRFRRPAPRSQPRQRSGLCLFLFGGNLPVSAGGRRGLMGQEEVAHLVYRLGEQVLLLFPRVRRHLSLRRQRH